MLALLFRVLPLILIFNMNGANQVRVDHGVVFLILLVVSVDNRSCAEELATAEWDYSAATTEGKRLQGAEGISDCNNGTGKDWVPPERLKEWFPVYKLGTDDDGVAIYLSLNGHFNFKKLLEEGTEEEKGAVDKYFDYTFDKFVWDDKASGGDGVISILDWDGFSIRDYNSPAVLRLAVKQFAKVGKTYNAIKETYSINTNFAAETFLNAAKPQLGKLLEKLQVYGTRKEKWMPQLRRLVPDSLLPTKYGGTNDHIDF